MPRDGRRRLGAAPMAQVLLVVGVLTAAAAGGDGKTGDELGSCRRWASAAFLGRSQLPPPKRPGIEVARQDHGKLRRCRSVIDTPLRIGKKPYRRGLGSHSVSEIIIRLPGPGVRFEAEAGVDNNHDTGGKRGSVIFAVDVGGKEAFRSGVCRGGQEPVPVRVDLGGADRFVLRVFDAGDGPGWDQADWANARVAMKDGTSMWLDEMKNLTRRAGLSTALPFSFTYGGRPSAALLGKWKRQQATAPLAGGRQRHSVAYTDPATGLKVTCELTLFAKYPAVEWVLRFHNTGKVDTPILKDILPLDLRTTGPVEGKVVLHHAHGSTCQPTDFLPIDRPVAPKSQITLAPRGGRSSDGQLPFFNLAWPDGGIVGAIGWSGQWSMRLERNASGAIRLRAGQEKTHLKLHPGESIRTPRILLVLWQGKDRYRGHNLLRRVLLDHYVPRIDGKIVVPPVTQNTWFVYNTGNDVTEQNQLDIMRSMAPLGVEAYWLDAGWFEGGWPGGVGSWVPKPKAFPRGLAPLGKAAHEKGMKFVLWFEPERVSPNSRIARQHAAFVLRTGRGDGLFNLGDPAARKWLTDHLAKCIADWGIDVYRNDFNIDPLRFWRAADKPDRQGICEIRYVEGLYAMWDDLRKRHPGLAIDNCASGGRRIDLETISRSYPLWKSDTQCGGRALPVQDQVQTAGISLYVPLHSAGCWGFDPYVFRSVALTGANICPDTRAANFPVAAAKAAIAEAKSLRPLYLGDYYPLLPINLDDSHWCGWQFDRPELGRGLAMLFRRPKSPYTAVDVSLRGLQPDALYDVTFSRTYTPAPTRQMTGAQLARLQVTIEKAPGSILVLYRKSNAKTGNPVPKGPRRKVNN